MHCVQGNESTVVRRRALDEFGRSSVRSLPPPQFPGFDDVPSDDNRKDQHQDSISGES